MMKTPCCIESVNKCPNTSSCSMILRSACSHSHSHKSLTSSEVRTQSAQRKRTSARKSVHGKISDASEHKSTIHLDSFLESSLKQLALKSTETYSILKRTLYDQLDLSKNQKNEVVEWNGKDLRCVTEHFSKTSTPVSSLYLKGHFISTEHELGNDHSIENLDSFDTTSMSRGRRFQRSALRALSGSDTEEEENSFVEHRVKLKRNSTSNTVSHTNSSAERIPPLKISTNVYQSSNHVNSQRSSTSAAFRTAEDTVTSTGYNSSTPIGGTGLNQRSFSQNSSEINISTVQDSMFDRFRWVIWRYVYLKIISSVNFDVWLLSRLRGSYKAVFILLLPLLIYLLSGALFGENRVISAPFDVICSSLSTVISSIYSLFSSLYVQSEKLQNEKTADYSCPSMSDVYAVLPSISGISSFFSSFFVKTGESTSFIHKTSFHSSDSSSKSSEESLSTENKFKLLAMEGRLNELAEKIQISNTQNAQDIKSLSVMMQQLQKDIQKLEKFSASIDDSRFAEYKLNIDLLNSKMKAFETKLDSFGALKKCCDQNLNPSDLIVSIEKHLVTAFRSVMDSNKNSNSPYYFFSEWLNSKFMDSKTLSTEIQMAFERMKKEKQADVKQDEINIKTIENVVQHYLESLKANLTVVNHIGKSYEDSLSHGDIKKIIREALLLYDADKIGLVDYALESGGGSVLGTRCSESFAEKNGKFSVFGFPLWSDENTPRTAIQPDVQPGKCWAFKGSQGFLVIQLSYTIRPTGFTLEHIPVSLSPTGSIDSAPKDFSVWGLASEVDNEGTLLGKYSYVEDGEPLQYFTVQNFSTEPFSFVELKIHSNHGNLEYTCLYRFRVHGTRVE